MVAKMAVFVFLLFAFTLTSQQEIENNCGNSYRKDLSSLEETFLNNVREPIIKLVERMMKEVPSDVLTENREIKEQLHNLQQDMASLKQKTDLSSGTRRSCESGKVTVSPYPSRLNPVEKRRVTFDQAFSSTPIVTQGISALDVDRNYNVQIDTYITALDTNGFYLNIKHWSDITMYKGGVTWMACPSL